MSKEKILKYLQENALDLRIKFPTLIDAKFETKPNRMLLIFDSNTPKAEEFVKSLDFKTEIVIQQIDLNRNIAGENENFTLWKERHKGAGLNEIVPETIKETINRTKNTEAYDAWKKRHSSVKIK